MKPSDSDARARAILMREGRFHARVDELTRDFGKKAEGGWVDGEERSRRGRLGSTAAPRYFFS